MSDHQRAWLLVVLGLVGVAAALVTAAVLPRPEAAGSPGAGFGPGPVTPGVPVTPAWREVVGLEPGIVAGSNDPCEAGDVACLDLVVAEMEARFDQLGCAHTAPFAFTYLEMTRGVRSHVAEPGFFADPSVVTQLDALFARLYFDAIDNWTADRHDQVPGAWQMAFQTADEGNASAAADLFLGMNAHISRDLAYAVAEIVGAGTGMLDDPADYLLVNDVIGAVQEPMLTGSAERFDPRLSQLPSLVPPESGVDSVELIARWRDRAFELGHALAAADSDAQREAVSAEIERTAVAGAVMILNADSSVPAVEDFDRDGYCESRRLGATQ